MEQHLRNYLQADKSPISGKNKGKLQSEIEKKDSKKLKCLPSLRSEQAEPEHCKQKKCLPRNCSSPWHLYLEVMLQCQDNPSEKAMFGNSQIKEQRERMKL